MKKHTRSKLAGNVGILFLLFSFHTQCIAEELGRFFTTPGERQMLDNLRTLADLPAPEPETKPEPELELVTEPEPEPEPEATVELPGVTINGVVYRKDGNSTAWLNGENTLDGDLESQYLQVDDNAIRGQHVPVEIILNQQKLNLKPGQTYQPEVDHVSDIYDQPTKEAATDKP